MGAECAYCGRVEADEVSQSDMESPQHLHMSSRCELNCRYDYDVSRHVSDDGRLKTLVPIKISGYQTKQRVSKNNECHYR